MALTHSTSDSSSSDMQNAAPIPHRDDVAVILRNCLRSMAYKPPQIQGTNERLEAAMQAEMDTRGLHCEQLEKTLHLAAYLIEVAYHDRNFAEKKNMALFNWYLIYVDDISAKDPSAVSVFQQRFISRKPQLDPVLDALAEVLLNVWELYDPLCANAMINSVFEFVTCSCIEREFGVSPLTRDAPRFPWFIRERTGLGEAFAFQIFPKTLKINIMDFVQAIPDMILWIALSNDILSFYKEEIAGETDNYVHTRAYMEHKTALQVLADMADELRMAGNVIHKALSHTPDALKAWQTFECGCVTWHLTQDRYKLKELCL